MPLRQFDPASLEGEALRRWYIRSPDDIEVERQSAEAQRYDNFFAATQREVQDGPVLYRVLAGPNDDVQFIEIGSKSRQHRRGWERQELQPWPTVPESGKNYHVSHIKAKGDGGSDTLDNIEPKHPVEHMEQHRKNGDFSRWGKRGGSNRSAPSKGGPKLRGLGAWMILPNITGMLSGRIRTDSFDNFASDMMGFPSEEDHLRDWEDYQRALNPKWKPGDPFRT
jgi:hypothetical protein